MNLLLKRSQSDEKCTKGILYVDNVYECFTLEDVVRPVKIPGETAIPAGIYNVEITYSPHFGRPMPLLDAVPGYEGVRIHPGNTEADTEGCILVGEGSGPDIITGSRIAFDALYRKIAAAKTNGEAVTITIMDA